MSTLSRSKKFREMATELIKTREDLEHLQGVRIAYLVSDQAKKSNKRTIFGECRKVSPQYAWTCPYDFFIVIYEPNTVEYGFDDEMYETLMWHELSHAGVEDTEAGQRFYIVPHDVEDFDKIIADKGAHWARKNQEGAEAIG